VPGDALAEAEADPVGMVDVEAQEVPAGTLDHDHFDGRIEPRQALLDPNGGLTRWTFDGLGRPVAVTDALGQTARTTYDGEGLKQSDVDRRGVVTNYTYDSPGRPPVTSPLPAVSGE